MKVIIFCGHKSRLGILSLAQTLSTNFEIIGVVIADDHRWRLFTERLTGELVPRKSVKNYLRSAKHFFTRDSDTYHWRVTKRMMKLRKIPLFCIQNANSPGFIQTLQGLCPDLFLVAAYPQILSEALLKVPLQGAVNIHPSLLPRFRGAHPHFWAIAQGEPHSGVTAHFMTRGIDDGDIIYQERFPIGQMNYGELYKQIVAALPELFINVENYFLNGIGTAVKQDNRLASTFTADRSIHHRIFWGLQTRSQILNLIRTERAFFFFNNRKIYLLSAVGEDTNRNLTNGVQVPSGTVIDISLTSVYIKVNEGCICVNEVRTQGRNLSGSQWVAKERVQIGEVLN